MRRLITLLIGISALISYQSQAHHSFAIYDIDNKIQRTGVLTEFSFSTPHIQLALEVENENGSKDTWKIESMNPRRWDRLGNSRDVASVGETVTIIGWPARIELQYCCSRNDWSKSSAPTAIAEQIKPFSNKSPTITQFPQLDKNRFWIRAFCKIRGAFS
jgi:hypothetical protein